MQPMLISSIAGKPVEATSKAPQAAEVPEVGEVESFEAVFQFAAAVTTADGLEADTALEELVVLEESVEPTADAKPDEGEETLLVEVPESQLGPDLETPLEEDPITEEAVAQEEGPKLNERSLTEALVQLQVQNPRIDEAAQDPRDVPKLADDATNPVPLRAEQQDRQVGTKLVLAQDEVLVETVRAPDSSSPRAFVTERNPEPTSSLPLEKAPAVAVGPGTLKSSSEPLKFQLEALPEKAKSSQLQLTWPATTTDKPQQTAVVSMPVQVTSAPLLAKAVQTGSFDKEKALQFEPGKLNFEGEIVGGSSLEGPKGAKQAINAVMSTVATRAELPVNVARQIAEVAARGQGQSVEVALHPAELGRVRMTLSPADTGMVISIQTERIETLDLMRRNIEALETAFSDLGYSDISFSFGTGERGSEDQDPAERLNAQAAPLMTDDVEGQPRPSDASTVGRVQGLDVRV